jgi:hypothetical protein
VTLACSSFFFFLIIIAKLLFRPAGALGASVELSGRLRVEALDADVTIAEDYGSRVKDLMTEATGALSGFHKHMYPKAETPRTLGELVGFFRVDADPLGDYSNT